MTIRKILTYATWALTKLILLPVSIALFVWLYVKEVRLSKKSRRARPWSDAWFSVRLAWREGLAIEKHYLKTGEFFF